MKLEEEERSIKEARGDKGARGLNKKEIIL